MCDELRVKAQPKNGFFLGKDGSATVEAALLYPIIFLAVISLMIAGSVWYQKAYFKAIVHSCTQSVAVCTTKSPELTIFKEDDLKPINQPVYYSRNTLNELILSNITRNLHKKQERFVIYPFMDQATKITTKVTNHLFYKLLLVEVQAGCRVPMGFLFGEIDENGLLLFREKTSVVLSDTSELSWNMDLVGDSLKRLDLKDKTDQLLQEILRPVKVLLEKMH